MNDRSRVMVSTCLGAILGGLVGYLYLTEDGRRVRERLEPGMDDLVRELRRLRGAVDKALVAVQEGVIAIEDVRRGATATARGEWAGRRPVSF